MHDRIDEAVERKLAQYRSQPRAEPFELGERFAMGKPNIRTEAFERGFAHFRKYRP